MHIHSGTQVYLIAIQNPQTPHKHPSQYVLRLDIEGENENRQEVALLLSQARERVKRWYPSAEPITMSVRERLIDNQGETLTICQSLDGEQTFSLSHQEAMELGLELNPEEVDA